jgi:hypothetical protein
LQEASLVSKSFLEKGGDWTPEEVVAARNKLLLLRGRILDSRGGSHVLPISQNIQGKMEGIVEVAYREVDRAMAVAEENKDSEDRYRALMVSQRLHNALIAMPEGVEPLIGPGDGVRFLRFSLKWGVILYVAFVPFALAIFFVRLGTFNRPLVEEVLVGWKNLLTSVVFWPLGLANYPGRETALETRKRILRTEFLARQGLTWSCDLTAAEQREVDELATLPIRAWGERLKAFQEVPRTVVWRARFAMYAIILFGAILSPFSSAFGQTRERVETEVHGFVQAGAATDGDHLSFGRFRLMGTVRTTDGVSAFLIHDTGGGWLSAAVTVQPEGLPVGLRLGRLTARTAFMTLPPHLEMVTGGPQIWDYVPIFDDGAEVFGGYRAISASVAVLSGSGIGPDDNDAKDVEVTVTLKPKSWLTAESGVEVGHQPDGLRSRALGHLSVRSSPWAFDLWAARQKLGDVSSVLSARLAHQLRPKLQLAGALDFLRPAGGVREKLVRLQANIVGRGGVLKISPTVRWSSVTGASAALQFQASL